MSTQVTKVQQPQNLQPLGPEWGWITEGPEIIGFIPEITEKRQTTTQKASKRVAIPK